METTIDQLKPRYQGLRVSREEYLDLDDDGFKYDVIDGEMVMAPSPFFEHGRYQNRFGFFLENYLQSNPIGLACVEIDVLLPDGKDPIRPDISFILHENMHFVKNHIHGCPDLICEVLSPSTKFRDLGIKADRYLNCGVKEYWIIDPNEKSLQLWVNKANQWLKNSDPVLQSKLLLGFEINQSIFFN